MKIVDYDYECMNVFITDDKGGICHKRAEDQNATHGETRDSQ